MTGRGSALITAFALSLAVVASSPAAARSAVPAAASAQPPVDPVIADTIAELKADGSHQFGIAPAPPIPKPGWLARVLGDFFEWLGKGGLPGVQLLGWLLIIALGLFLLYLFVPVVRDTVDAAIARLRGRGGKDDAAADDWQPDHAAARNLLAEADALAAAGRFDEAVHLLLGRSLEDIQSRRPGLLKPALTARAIAAMRDLPDAARAAFGRIAEAVERSRWARRALAEPDWQQARASYEAFAFGEHWRARAA